MANTSPTITNSSVTIWATTTSILTADSWRSFLYLANDSNEDMYIAFWSAAVMNSWMVLKANWWQISFSWEDETSAIIRATVNWICASGSKNLTLVSK